MNMKKTLSLGAALLALTTMLWGAAVQAQPSFRGTAGASKAKSKRCFYEVVTVRASP
jgi:hypothetical protein